MRIKKFILSFVIVIVFCSIANGAVTNPPKVIIEYLFNDARDFHEGLAAVKSKDVWGYINNLGHYVIPPTLRIPEAGDFSEGLAFVGDHYITTTGAQAFLTEEDNEPKMFSNGLPFSEGFAAVQIGGQWGFINLTGKFVITPIYEKAQSFSEGLAAVRRNGLWGFIDNEGELKIPYKFVKARSFHEGLAAVQIKGYWGFIDKTGRVILKPRFYEAGDFYYGLAPVRSKTNYRGWGYVNTRGRFAIPRKYNNAKTFSEGLAPAVADARWGFINVRGQWELSPSYDEARQFSEGLAAVRQDNKWGYIRE